MKSGQTVAENDTQRIQFYTENYWSPPIIRYVVTCRMCHRNLESMLSLDVCCCDHSNAPRLYCKECFMGGELCDCDIHTNTSDKLRKLCNMLNFFNGLQ